MRTRFARLAVSTAALALVASTAAPIAAAAPDPADATDGVPPPVQHRPSCAVETPGHARCFAHVRQDVPFRPELPSRFKPGWGLGLRPGGGLGQSPATTANVLPSGLGPADLRAAYGLPTPSGSPGSGPTVAIVDAYDDPTAEADLQLYRATYGLGGCSSANGCFTKVDQNGAPVAATATTNTGWGEEISLDVDMVSATCPDCKILLVEASSSSFSDLVTAEATAVRLGAVAVSNSYGATEGSWEQGYWDSKYNFPGVAITASAGDAGYGVEFPAASEFVTAVGGTTLTRNTATTRGWTERAWSGSGSGCSAFISKPSWQKDAGCSHRTVADVSAVADPATGVAVYDTFGDSGWLVIGGTSVASPLVASIYALRGNTASLTYGSYSYAHLGSLYDIRSGSDGTCSPAYLCTAERGYDGPTGNGTPHGTGAF